VVRDIAIVSRHGLRHFTRRRLRLVSMFSTILIPAIGLLSSGLVFPSIVGACGTVKLWHAKQCEFFLRHPAFKTAFELQRPAWIESRGLLFPKVIPVLFGVFWLVIHIASYFL